MKWAKQLDALLLALPDGVREHSIVYRRWKWRVRRGECSIGRLYAECALVDAMFRRMHRHSARFDRAVTLHFAALNRTTVYKVCKRIDKAAAAAEAATGAAADGADPKKAWLRWYADTRRSGLFAFMGGMQVSHLELALGRRPAHCPICFAEGAPATHGADATDLHPTFVVPICGHELCTDCVTRMYGSKGKLHNLVHTYTATHAMTDVGMHCCVCRHYAPFRRSMPFRRPMRDGEQAADGGGPHNRLRLLLRSCPRLLLGCLQGGAG